MTRRRLFVAAMIVVLVSASLWADTESIPVAAPLSAEAFAALDLYHIPTAGNFSPGWDSIRSVSISEDRLVRFFYRKIDGLMVGVLEDNTGGVYAQTRAWFIGAGLDQFDVTLSTQATPWATALIVFGYQRSTGFVVRKWIGWQAWDR